MLIVTIGAGFLVVFIEKPHTLYIRITDVVWPPPDYTIGENYTSYYIHMLCEIWNPTKRTLTHHTPNSNLLDPHMEIKLKENYTATSGYAYWIYITTHKIKPGISKLVTIMFIDVTNYNSSVPPEGNYTIWSGIDGNPELYGHPQFNYTSYNTTILHTSSGNSFAFEPTPDNWGEVEWYDRELALIIIWTLAGGEGVVIVVLLVKNVKKKKEQKELH